jgi:SAM-dependent methyltransferase
MVDLYPEFFARFYDLIYHQVRDGADSNFYLNKIKNTRGKVLEAGSGTGRLFYDALKNGADIYGIDISPAMLEILKVRISPENQKRISLQSIVDFKSDFRFDLIIAPFRVFMHLIRKDDQMEALKNVYYYLNEGGEFIFDVFVPDLKSLVDGLLNVVDFDGEYEPEKRVKRIVSTKPELINQILNISFRFEWNDGVADFKKEWKTSLRYFFRYELEHLIERSDFNNNKITGSFLGDELNEDSKEFIVICKK